EVRTRDGLLVRDDRQRLDRSLAQPARAPRLVKRCDEGSKGREGHQAEAPRDGLDAERATCPRVLLIESCDNRFNATHALARVCFRPLPPPRARSVVSICR